MKLTPEEDAKIDAAFAKVWNDWAAGVMIDARIREERHRVDTLVKELNRRGYRVEFAECMTQIQAFRPGEEQYAMAISIYNAQEMPTEKLIEWISNHERFHGDAHRQVQ